MAESFLTVCALFVIFVARNSAQAAGSLGTAYFDIPSQGPSDQYKIASVQKVEEPWPLGREPCLNPPGDSFLLPVIDTEEVVYSNRVDWRLAQWC